MKRIGTITAKTAGQLRRQACDYRMLLSPRLCAAGIDDGDLLEAAKDLDRAAERIEHALTRAAWRASRDRGKQ